METDRPECLEQWLAKWRDLIEFEVYPVISSKEAADQVSSRLQNAVEQIVGRERRKRVSQVDWCGEG
jgi:hypothetical protein